MAHKARRLAELGRRIAAAREAAGLTQTDVARLLGVTQATVSRLEGGLQEPTALRLADLAEALGVTADDLLGRPRP